MCREKAGGQDEMRMLRAMYAEGEERLGRRESKRQDWMRGICWNLSQVWIRHIIIWSRIAGWNKAWHRNMKKW